MMAAIRASELLDSGEVILLEKNAELGRKLLLTGGGRCNITNIAQKDEFLAAFGKKGLFLRKAFELFPPYKLIRFFSENGLEMKTEDMGRVFPVTDSSKSVLGVMENILRKKGIRVYLNSPVKELIIENNKIRGFRLVKQGKNEDITADAVIVAAGGLSYPQTGSTGDGYTMAQTVGHCIETLRPGLVPLNTVEEFVKELQGLVLKNVKISFYAGSKLIKSSSGELLFTHFGISGPLILDLSESVCSHFEKNKFDPPRRTIDRSVSAFIDLKPDLSEQDMDLQFRTEFQKAGALMMKNYLKNILSGRMIGVFLKICAIEEDKKCSQITSMERKKMIAMLKKFPLTIKNARPVSEAMVTCGGVSLKEIDSKTMASKIVKGLYFCGEVLDLSAKSGGFNLQAAFSTGYLAGQSATWYLTQ